MGKVIGAKGTVIQHIQRETQAKVSTLPTSPDKLWSPFTITGAPDNVFAAYALIKVIVEGQQILLRFLLCQFEEKSS